MEIVQNSVTCINISNLSFVLQMCILNYYSVIYPYCLNTSTTKLKDFMF